MKKRIVTAGAMLVLLAGCASSDDRTATAGSGSASSDPSPASVFRDAVVDDSHPGEVDVLVADKAAAVKVCTTMQNGHWPFNGSITRVHFLEQGAQGEPGFDRHRYTEPGTLMVCGAPKRAAKPAPADGQYVDPTN
jgi:hypothetical protein